MYVWMSYIRNRRVNTRGKNIYIITLIIGSLCLYRNFDIPKKGKKTIKIYVIYWRFIIFNYFLSIDEAKLRERHLTGIPRTEGVDF